MHPSSECLALELQVQQRRERQEGGEDRQGLPPEEEGRPFANSLCASTCQIGRSGPRPEGIRVSGWLPSTTALDDGSMGRECDPPSSSENTGSLPQGHWRGQSNDPTKCTIIVVVFCELTCSCPFLLDGTFGDVFSLLCSLHCGPVRLHNACNNNNNNHFFFRVYVKNVETTLGHDV